MCLAGLGIGNAYRILSGRAELEEKCGELSVDGSVLEVILKK
jgi:hypothetical protein